MQRDILQQAEEIIEERVDQLDRAADEVHHLRQVQGTLFALCDRLGRDHEEWTMLYTFAHMLDRSILSRCPHDPVGYVRRETNRWDYLGTPYVTVETQCLHCDARETDSDPLTKMQAKYGREIVPDD